MLERSWGTQSEAEDLELAAESCVSLYQGAPGSALEAGRWHWKSTQKGSEDGSSEEDPGARLPSFPFCSTQATTLLAGVIHTLRLQ